MTSETPRSSHTSPGAYRPRGRRYRARLRGAAFWAGMIVTLVAISPPIHALADETFAAHMVQHLLLILLAAPLIAVGRPLGTVMELLPRPSRRHVGAAMGRLFARPVPRTLWRWVTAPLVAWTLHTLAVWLWHAPPLFEGALASDALHALEHASFLGTGVLYWWALLHDGAHQRHGYAMATISVFAMAMQSGALGALLTFSTVPWYPAYAAGEAQWGLAPIDDQQLAGLIMWVPAGLGYTAIALGMFALWLQREGTEESGVRRYAEATYTSAAHAGAAHAGAAHAGTTYTGGSPAASPAAHR